MQRPSSKIINPNDGYELRQLLTILHPIALKQTASQAVSGWSSYQPLGLRYAIIRLRGVQAIEVGEMILGTCRKGSNQLQESGRGVLGDRGGGGDCG